MIFGGNGPPETPPLGGSICKLGFREQPPAEFADRAYSRTWTWTQWFLGSSLRTALSPPWRRARARAADTSAKVAPEMSKQVPFSCGEGGTHEPSARRAATGGFTTTPFSR